MTMGPDAQIGRKHDPEAINRRRKIRGVDGAFADSVEEGVLFQFAKLIVIRLVGHLDDFVGVSERIVGVQFRMV